MNYEEKMKFLQNVRPDKKDEALLRIIKGEQDVDITKDEDLFYQINKDRVSIEEFVNRDKFLQDAKEMKDIKSGLWDKKHGFTPSKKARLLGEIPAEIFFSRKELSDPMLSKEERSKNIKKFFNTFPAFKAGDGKL